MSTGKLRRWQAFSVARVTIQFHSAFLVARGEGDGLFDEVFVTDANGLPAIPGSSLAGVCRHALGRVEGFNIPRIEKLFGYQRPGNKSETAEAQDSLIRFSWGQVHDSDDRPVPFIHADMKDQLLSFLAAGVFRDHVRIGSHGAVDGAGKFDELVVPAGSRFTFEFELDDASDVRPEQIVAVLRGRDARIGKGSRHGLGDFEVLRWSAAHFNCLNEADRKRLSKMSPHLQDHGDGVFEPQSLPDASVGQNVATGTITLTAENSWFVAGTVPMGEAFLDESGNKPLKEADRFPLAEGMIHWDITGRENRGVVLTDEKARFLLPGTSVKGALRHRFAFHLRTILGRTWDPDNPEAFPDDTPLPGEEAVFGAAKSATQRGQDEADSEEDMGRPSRLVVGDVMLKSAPRQSAFDHVCLDRFTQAPVDGKLFGERTLLGGEVEIPVTLYHGGLDADAKKALCRAIKDLAEGRLGLGAGRGHGRFRGTVCWDDQGKWMEVQ